MTDLLTTFDAFKQQAQQPLATTSQQRIEQLTTLEQLLAHNASTLAHEITTDFHFRHVEETKVLDIAPAISCIRYIKKNLTQWMQPSARKVPWYLQKMNAAMHYQPLGVIGIMVPFNYPLLLSVQPLAYALAAGNQAMLKISELTPSFGAALTQLINASPLSKNVAIINGDLAIAKQFASLPWDHLFFTGSAQIGKHILHAAADNLTPTTLELGGKSPALIAPEYPVNYAAKRIMHSKLINAGQTCIATDYVLLHHSQLKTFVPAAQKEALKLYPQRQLDTGVINEQQIKRLNEYLTDATQQGAHVIKLFNNNNANFPCLVTNTHSSMRLMQAELFGPILPIVTYNHWHEAIAYINNHPSPLAVYCFSQHKKQVEQLIQQTKSGAVLTNGCVIHVAIPDLPFGGVGESGFGRYHGKEGFCNFSNQRAIIKQSRCNLMRYFMPPYNAFKLSLLRMLFGIK